MTNPPQEDIKRLPLILMTYNMDNTVSTSGVFRLLHNHQPDILALQEVNLNLLDKHTIQHNAFIRKLRHDGYTIQMSSENLTIIKELTLGPYLAESFASPDGRILITPLTLTHTFTIYILNTYGCQQSELDYLTINSNLINFLGDFVDNQGGPNCHYIPIGDINIDPQKHGHRPANLHSYFLSHLKTYSTFCQLQQLNRRTDGTLPPLPDTFVDTKKGSSCLDHCCLPYSLLPNDLQENEESQPQILPKEYNSSPHHPLLQRVIVPFLDFDEIQNTDVPHPLYRILSSIPLRSGPDPTDPEDKSGWFQPNDTLIPPSKLDSKQALITKAHSLQITDTELQRLEIETRQLITQITHKVRDHYRETSELMPRTRHTKELLTDAFTNIDHALYRTMTLLDLQPDLATEKSQPSMSLSLRLELKVDTLRTTIKRIKRNTRTSTTSSLLQLFKRLTRQVTSLHGVITKIEHKIKSTNEDYAALVSIQNARKEAQRNKDVSSEQLEKDKKKKKKKKTHRPLISSNKDAPVQSTDDIFLRRQSSFLKFITRTKNIIIQMSDELTIFCAHAKHNDQAISRAFINIFHDNYIPKLRKRTRKVITHFDNIQVDFHHLYGDSSKPASLIKLKSNPKPAANTTIPTFDNPLAPPHHIPAIGPIQQKYATCVTQQLQADKPPGNPLHFVEIQNDDVGPCGIKFFPNKPFTADDLSSYHPQAKDFPPDVQKAIIDAHETFPTITKYLYDKHSSNRNAPATQWPYRAKVDIDPTTHEESLVFTKPIPSMQQQIFYTPSAARLNGFTLNVLARLHPCWMRLLDQLTNLILVTRILPPQLKTTGRVLIDKPGTTDKRPISILHAFDSYIDTIVAKSLASAVEALDIYDDTIAAYRPGHSCADCTLNHLLAIQDTRSRDDIKLCQLDEDKEKFFDRITTQLQLLPFHLMGFPPKGYIEWIAESLDGITILTGTPYGRVTTSFSCGVRQGSALSCVIANAVAWLSAAPWAIPLEGFPIPTGHAPSHLHPFDIAHNNPATLYKSSYCDDSSSYITAPTKEQLFDNISRDVYMSNVMSIVTKLSINAKKSHIRIFGLTPEEPVPHYAYTSWHHSTRTVRKETIPTDNMSSLDINTIMRHFGTFINPRGQTQSSHKQHFSKMHAARKSFRHKTYSTLTFTAQYASLVTSTIGFNVLAMSYDLHKAVKDDHITLYRHATKAYDLTLPADKFYNIFLPRQQLGQGFKGILTIQLAIALARELFVSLNAPHPQYTNLLQTRMRAMLHRLTFTASDYDPLDTIPHAIQQLALLGIYIRPTELPIVNNAIALLQDQDDKVTALGYPSPCQRDQPSPLVSILNEHNKLHTLIETPYRNLILSLHDLYQTPVSPFHKPQAYSEITENPHDTLPRRCTDNNPLSLQTSPSSQGIYIIQAASRELMPHYNHLSHFFELDFTHKPRYADPNNFLNNHPLPLSAFTPISLFGDEEYPSWPDSPHRSLRRFQNLHRLSIRYRRNIPSILPGIFQRYSSPLLFSSDSAYNHNTECTIAASILMHFDTKRSTSPLRIPPIPILLRNHVLAKSYGTKFTDNNMGESMALTISLNTCPCNVPAIFLLDSKLVLLQVFLYFFPKSHTIRNILRRYIHTTSIHHYSELSEALQQHWPDATLRPSRIRCDPDVPQHVIQSFQEILTTLTNDLTPKTICHLQSSDAQSTSSTEAALSNDTTAGLLIGHHLFLHINSHQLTNTGKLKTTMTADKKKVTIQPRPNINFALANTWADRGASRPAKSLTDDNRPHLLLPDIPQPPITILQYVPHHHQRTINTDSTQYIQNQFVNHNFKIAINDSAQWFLHFGPYFTDPLEKFHNNRVLREIAQDKAYSHSRYVKINKEYRLSMQRRCHPTTTLPQRKYTSTMLQCPFCPSSTIPATITHHHIACTHKVILRKRQSLLRPINAILQDLDTVTTYLINFILPNQTPNKYIPRFTKFLRAAIQNVTFITALTDKEKKEYADTTEYPPFKDLGYPNKPHWRHDGPDPTVYPPTTAHYTHLMGPSCDPPMHPLEHSTIIAILGLLPTNTHIALEDYFDMLTTKFLQALKSRHLLDPKHEEDPPSLSVILNPLEDDFDHEDLPSVQSIIRKARATNHKVNDIANLLSHLLQTLLQALQTKARSLQLKINSTLQEYIRKIIKADRLPPVPAPSPQVPSSKSSKPPRRKRQKSDCPGPWCILRKAAGIPWTTTATSVQCTQCRLMLEAVNLSTKLLAQIISRPNAISLFLQYTPVSTHRMQITTMANNIAIVPVPLDELRDIICNTIPFTVLHDISPHINFLNPADAQYEKPRQDLQQLVLQLIAYSSLILPTPSLTREFPPLSPYSTHSKLTTATTFCACSKSAPIQICNTNLCNNCSLLIPNSAHVSSHDPHDIHTCITCDKTITHPKFPDKPCDACCIITIMLQNNPSSTWFRLTKRTTPSIISHVHTTPICFLPHPLQQPPSHCPLPSTDIFIPTKVTPPEDIYPFTKDPDFLFQDFPEEETFLTHRILPPRPPPMPFPNTYTSPANKSQNIVTNVYRYSHQALFSYPGSVYLTYTRPAFPFIDGIRAPEFGHYPEAHFDDNLPNLDRSLPHVDIIPVSIYQHHPMREYMSGLTGRLTITWSFHSHDKRDPNQSLGPTPETFILTFYPPLSMNPPFQLRLLFHKGCHLDELPEPTLDETDVLQFTANKPNETPTIYVLAIIYLMATLPPEFVNERTLYHYRLLLPSNLRKLSNEMVYLHAILNDDNHAVLLRSITSPWTLTYNKPQPPYTITIQYRENPKRRHHHKRRREILEPQINNTTSHRNME